MIELYCRLIIKGKRKFESIPSNKQAEVKAMLEEKGYTTDGELIVNEA